MHFALRLSFEGTTVNLRDSGLNREVLLGALLSLLPATLIDELSAITPPTPATGGQTG